MPKLNRLFKKIQKFDVIENDKIKHLFKITHLDNSTAVYDNNGNLVMKSTFNKVFVKTNKEKKWKKLKNQKFYFPMAMNIGR